MSVSKGTVAAALAEFTTLVESLQDALEAHHTDGMVSGRDCAICMEVQPMVHAAFERVDAALVALKGGGG